MTEKKTPRAKKARTVRIPVPALKVGAHTLSPGGRGKGEGDAPTKPGKADNGEMDPGTLRGTEAADLTHGKAMNDSPRRIVVFDLETQKLADEVGGWGNIAGMKVSLAVTYTEEHGFLTFTEDKVPELIDLLKSADLVVGFNQLRFDYEVLSAYSPENLRALPNLDILVDVAKVLGFRLALDHLAESTLGRKKSGMGLEAVRWFREGRMDLLEKYCRDDVRITRDLYRFGLENGFLLYRRRDGQVARIPVDWVDNEARVTSDQWKSARQKLR